MIWSSIVKAAFILLTSEDTLRSLLGAYIMSPDFKSITPVIQNISVANGVALSTDERVLWVTETTTIVYIVLN